jgi:hypothetical protein
MKVTLDEKQLNEIQAILNQLPISHLNQVQKIVEILNSGVEQVDEDAIKK